MMLMIIMIIMIIMIMTTTINVSLYRKALSQDIPGISQFPSIIMIVAHAVGPCALRYMRPYRLVELIT